MLTAMPIPETAMINPVKPKNASRMFPTRFLMSRDITLVEFLDNLAALRRREFFFMALPFKVAGIDSAPVRAIAIEEREEEG